MPVPLSRRGGSSSKIAAASPLATTAPSARGIDPLIGQLVASRYRVLSTLGEGGMGNVYRAVQESIEKKVALKVLKAEYSSSPDMVVRFHREAVSACRIKHPNVVDVFDLGQLADGRFYIAMDLLEGKDLGQVITSSGPLVPARAVHIALQICRALNAAHQSGIVHRDLKPENIFLHRTSDGDEIVKIVDFGIAHLLAHGADRTPPPRLPSDHDDHPAHDAASDGDRKLTRVGTVFGTPEYMAPEQAEGVHIDHRADIYATGIIIYKMLHRQSTVYRYVVPRDHQQARWRRAAADVEGESRAFDTQRARAGHLPGARQEARGSIRKHGALCAGDCVCIARHSQGASGRAPRAALHRAGCAGDWSRGFRSVVRASSRRRSRAGARSGADDGGSDCACCDCAA